MIDRRPMGSGAGWMEAHHRIARWSLSTAPVAAVGPPATLQDLHYRPNGFGFQG